MEDGSSSSATFLRLTETEGIKTDHEPIELRNAETETEVTEISERQASHKISKFAGLPLNTIETNGHNLDIILENSQSTIHTDDIIMRGYLRKRYRNNYYMGSYRFCVLRGVCLRWFISEEDATTGTRWRGEEYVKAIERWSGFGSIRTYPHAFAIHTESGRVLLCSASTLKEKKNWVDAIETALKASGSRHTSATFGMLEGNPDGRRIVPEDIIRNHQRLGYGNTFLGNADQPIPSSADTSSLGLSTANSAQTQAPRECYQCKHHFKKFVSRRIVCSSCNWTFCRRHCRQFISLYHIESNNSFLRRCCNGCVIRQDFLKYLDSFIKFLNALVQKRQTVKMLIESKLSEAIRGDGTPNQFQSESYPSVVERLRTDPMSLIRTIKILYRSRRDPCLFRIACERLPFYIENSIDRVETLWYQILHLVQCLEDDIDVSFIQIFYLKRYIRAVCRRSPRIALQTIWNTQASLNDITSHNSNLLLEVLAFTFPPTRLRLTSDNDIECPDLWSDMILMDSPDHQRCAIIARLMHVSRYVEGIIQEDGEEAWVDRWLNANSPQEFQKSAKELHETGISLCEQQTSITYESLDVPSLQKDAEKINAGSLVFEDLVMKQVQFVKSLAAISDGLRGVYPEKRRSVVLEEELIRLNEQLHDTLYPLSSASDELYRVLRVPPTEGKVFMTKERAPTMLLVETVPLHARDEAVYGDDDRILRPFLSSSRLSCTILDFEMDEKKYVPEAPTSLHLDELDDEASQFTDSQCSVKTAPWLTPCARSTSARAQRSTEMWREFSTDVEDDGPEYSQTMINTHPARSSVHHDSSHFREAEGDTGSFRRKSHHDVGESLVYNCNVYGESWKDKQERIRRNSPVGNLPGWKLFTIIVKTNDDLRQEMFTMQIIQKFQSVFQRENLPLWLRTYRIVATGANIGLLETITDACSLDHLKKSFGNGEKTLYEYFQAAYGDTRSMTVSKYVAEVGLEEARNNFINSMAAYSLVSYILLLKDRHNGNILLNAQGHLIHIDFGFILGIAPGGAFSLEDAPFKLTHEMVQVMGGLDSDGYQQYRRLLCDGFVAVRKYQREILALLQTTGQQSPFPCFSPGKSNKKKHLARLLAGVHDRLHTPKSREELEKKVDYLLRKSYNAWGTRRYDAYQLRSNNIYP
ncbi:hypothetical protein ABG067_002822 [Albugo candida]